MKASIRWGSLWMFVLCTAVQGAETPTPGRIDSRIRTALYDPAQVYRLQGYAGYAIDLEFSADEEVTGVGGGDLEGIIVGTSANHITLKPKSVPLASNFAIYTNRRVYHIDYRASVDEPSAMGSDVIYAVRFSYPEATNKTAETKAEIEAKLSWHVQALNRDYWICGDISLQPDTAHDDGLQTHFRWPVNAPWPAVYLLEHDGTETLLPFSVHEGEMVLPMTAREFVVRRGPFSACIQNRSYGRLIRAPIQGTVSPQVRRVLKEAR